MSSHLNNTDLTALRVRVDKITREAQLGYYSLHKSTLTLIDSQNYFGPYAEAFKRYLRNVTNQTIAELLELTEEVARIARKIERDFLAFESAASGIVNQSRLESVRDTLLTHQNTFQGDIDRVSRTNERIKGLGVTTGALGRNAVVGSYRDARSELLNINMELNNIDRQNLAELARIEGRIERLRAILVNIRGTVSRGPMNCVELRMIPQILTDVPGVLLNMKAQDPTSGFGARNALGSHRWTRWDGRGVFRDNEWQFGFGNHGHFNGMDWAQAGIFNWNRQMFFCSDRDIHGNTDFTALAIGRERADGHNSVTFTGATFGHGAVGPDGGFVGGANFLSGDAHGTWQVQDSNNFNVGGGGGITLLDVEGTYINDVQTAVGANVGPGLNFGLNVSSQEVRNTGDGQINYVSVDLRIPIGPAGTLNVSESREIAIPNSWNW